MWRMTRLAIVFYSIIIWSTSLAVMLFVTHYLKLDTIQQITYAVYNDDQARIIVFCIALGVVMVSIVLEDLIYGRRRRERNIVFDNPAGPVSVSLAALEDLIKRLSNQVPEVKEIRPTVLAVKKGLDIDIKLVMRSEGNIPDLTARLQELVRRKIEETIQMEGKINIHIHVIKISLDDIKNHRRPVRIDEPHVPFHGYRA